MMVMWSWAEGPSKDKDGKKAVRPRRMVTRIFSMYLDTLLSVDLKRREMLLSRHGIASSQDILVGVQEQGLFQSVD
jgi:hypothetical protein